METTNTNQIRMRYGDQRVIVRATGGLVSEQALSGYLNHGFRPTWENAKALAGVTGTDPADWMDGRREKLLAALSTPEARGRLDALKREQEKGNPPNPPFSKGGTSGLRRDDGEEAVA